MGIDTISEAFLPPRILSQPQRMVDFTDEMRRCGYVLEGCAKRLGSFPSFGVNFWRPLRPDWTACHDDPVDTLLDLFMDGRQVPVDCLKDHFSSAFIDSALEMNLAERTGPFLESKLCLFPVGGKYVVTDRPEKNTNINQVMWLWSESFFLGGVIKRSRHKKAVDLGTGSGVHALLASDHCKETIGVDINPRALMFSGFNAALNGVENVQFMLNDLLSSIDSTFDLLIANPPYLPDRAAKAGDNFWSGGIEGTELLQKIIEALPAKLEVGGIAYISALFPNPPGTVTRDHFNNWLDGTLDCYEVLDLTWPVPGFKDLLSEQPFEGDKSAWRFGVVSLRRLPSAKGWWREARGGRRFFGPDGNCIMIANHDAE